VREPTPGSLSGSQQSGAGGDEIRTLGPTLEAPRVLAALNPAHAVGIFIAGKGQLLDVDLPHLRQQLEASRDYVFAAAGIEQDLFRSN